eukprot:8253751-Alexandrium_andersonii.AAC.1
MPMRQTLIVMHVNVCGHEKMQDQRHQLVPMTLVQIVDLTQCGFAPNPPYLLKRSDLQQPHGMV